MLTNNGLNFSSVVVSYNIGLSKCKQIQIYNIIFQITNDKTKIYRITQTKLQFINKWLASVKLLIMSLVQASVRV